MQRSAAQKRLAPTRREGGGYRPAGTASGKRRIHVEPSQITRQPEVTFALEGGHKLEPKVKSARRPGLRKPSRVEAARWPSTKTGEEAPRNGKRTRSSLDQL